MVRLRCGVRLDEIVDFVEGAFDFVDYWHVVEKFGTALQACSLSEHAASQMLSLWKGWLLNDDDAPERIRKHLSKHAGHGAVDDAITYIDNNIDRMRYADARRRGLPIGSGNVEASCKSIGCGSLTTTRNR